MRLILQTQILKTEFIDSIGKNENVIYKVCRLYCNTKDDQKDLYQDIVLQLWRAYPSFRKESKISTWIYRIALNTAITRLRKETQKPRKENLTLEVVESTAAGSGEEDEQFSQILYAIEKLSAIEKALIMLFLDDLSYREISMIMGISESNVGYKLNQAKAKLKSILKKKEHYGA